MHLEIECKMRVDDVAAVEARLSAAGAQRVREVFEHNTYFDSPDGSLRNQDRGLRVRVEKVVDTGNETVVVTHKGPRLPGPLKTRPETQFATDDASAVTGLFVSLGLEPVLAFEKRRRVWRYQDCEVVIDTLPYLGDFVEIEGPSQEAVFESRQSLGLDDRPLIETSYIAMLCDYATQHGVTAREIRFESS